MSGPLQLACAAETLFPDLDLGDARLNRRFDQVVQTIAPQPGASLPQLFPNPSDDHACLDLFDSPRASHENRFAAHQESALNAMERHVGIVLNLHDTTVLDFSGHTTLEDDLGPIGNGGGRGWLAHQTLAVDPVTRTVFGLIGQILHVREPAPKGETAAHKRDRQSRESRLWQRALDEIGPTPRDAHGIEVADRGADIFEFLQQLLDRNRRFVIRSQPNRALGVGASDRKSEVLLHDRMRSLAPTATWTLEIPAKANCPSRVATLSGVAERVVIRPPHVKKGHYRSESLELTAIRGWEADPPPGVEPLEWLLLTTEPAEQPDQIERVSGWYACRMQIEEFHKVQQERSEGGRLPGAVGRKEGQSGGGAERDRGGDDEPALGGARP